MSEGKDFVIETLSLTETTETAAEAAKQDELTTTIEVSPNGKYLVTCSSKENNLIVEWKLWNAEVIDEGPIELIKINDKIKNLKQICVSDDKKLVYIVDKQLSK